jgi:hypothetical protein
VSEKSDLYFGKNARPGPGRPPGVKDARTKRGEELARLVVEHNFESLVDRFLQSEDDKIALEAFKFLYDHAFGKAKIRAEVDSTKRVATIRFDVGNRRLDAEAERVLDAELAGGDESGDRACLPAPEGECGSGPLSGDERADRVLWGRNQDREDGGSGDLGA